jgi:hypothetical protein
MSDQGVVGVDQGASTKAGTKEDLTEDPGCAALAAVCQSAPSTCHPLHVDPATAPAGALGDDERAAVADLRARVTACIPLWAERHPGNRAAGCMVAEAQAHLDDFTLHR